MTLTGPRTPLAAVMAALLLVAGCSGGDESREISFTVERLEEGTAVDRVPRRIVPGGEVIVSGVARNPHVAEQLWEQAGFTDSAPSLSDDEALVLIVGGEAVACPWEPRSMEVTGPGFVSVDVGHEPGTHCGAEWRPRALALTVDTDDLPQDPFELEVRAFEPRPFVVELGADGPQHLADAPIPGAVPGPEDGDPLPDEPPEQRVEQRAPDDLDESGGEPAVLTMAAVSRYPGFDAVHFQFDGRDPFTRAIAYVAPPLRDASGAPVEMTGNAFLESQIGPLSLHAYGGPDRLEGPPTAAITELVLLGAVNDTARWVIGVRGEPTPAVTSTTRFRSPNQRTGSALTIHVRHPNR